MRGKGIHASPVLARQSSGGELGLGLAGCPGVAELGGGQGLGSTAEET